MADQAANILRRKARSSRAASSAARITPESALKLAFGRAGRGLAGLGLRMVGFADERSTVAGLAGAVPEAGLVTTLRRASGGTGVLIVDPGMTAALIESETMGRVGRATGAPRPPTRIDALIVGAFVDAALAEFDGLAESLSIAAAVTGWRVGEMIADPATMPLVVEDVAMRSFRIGFDFGDGARSGTAQIALPLAPPRPVVAPDAAAEGLARDLERRVMAAQAEVRAVLARLSLPLDEVTAWQPGGLLPLPRESLLSVRLEDIDGALLARGKLGRVNGNRALRLLPPVGGD
ncbi:FliM/FliN family flagellar motor switch protein [Frigidibacter sp. ROC022]|uniref:FliM/FliN family flagellar motor switch protein n=1 Tax=Frigidibacter sp. ROC022 TaxID=2971796 RepID=UPI00215AB910|nr:FliM/FliN family flagellar motor switch protein [Frigidibacter sp. ROC022]MCR8723237.1 FliM/FliN family flagellar motor switch protein [Frigidibacter sp. ROC022]